MSENGNLRVLVLMGGASREREISLQSGRAVADALAGAGCEVEARTIDVVADVLGMDDLSAWDVVFPALHGGEGEDGHLQSLLEIRRVPYALSGPLASAVAMDKAATKRMLRGAGIPTPDWLLVEADGEADAWPDRGALLRRVGEELGWPVVVKPNADGSSVGVRIVDASATWRRPWPPRPPAGGTCSVETYVPGRELTAGHPARPAAPAARDPAPRGLLRLRAQVHRRAQRVPRARRR